MNTGYATLKEALRGVIGKEPSWADQLYEDRQKTIPTGFRLKYYGPFSPDLVLKVKQVLERHHDYVVGFQPNFIQKKGVATVGKQFVVITLLTNPNVIPYKKDTNPYSTQNLKTLNYASNLFV